MQVASGSMRQGILYDLLGRFQHNDMRDITVSQFMQRYHVDSKQARRVANLALTLYRRFTAGDDASDDAAPHYIGWAAKLHEIGISVAYSGYHKHSAYIVRARRHAGLLEDGARSGSPRSCSRIAARSRRYLRTTSRSSTGAWSWACA